MWKKHKINKKSGNHYDVPDFLFLKELLESPRTIYLLAVFDFRASYSVLSALTP